MYEAVKYIILPEEKLAEISNSDGDKTLNLAILFPIKETDMKGIMQIKENICPHLKSNYNYETKQKAKSILTGKDCRSSHERYYRSNNEAVLMHTGRGENILHKHNSNGRSMISNKKANKIKRQRERLKTLFLETLQEQRRSSDAGRKSFEHFTQT